MTGRENRAIAKDKKEDAEKKEAWEVVKKDTRGVEPRGSRRTGFP